MLAEDMARPRKTDRSLRSRQISFRLTEGEHDALVALAAQVGLSPGELARRIVRQRRSDLVIETSSRVDPALLKRVEQIGRNINQLVKNAHIYKRVSPKLEPLCEEIQDLVLTATTRESGA